MIIQNSGLLNRSSSLVELKFGSQRAGRADECDCEYLLDLVNQLERDKA